VLKSRFNASKCRLSNLILCLIESKPFTDVLVGMGGVLVFVPISSYFDFPLSFPFDFLRRGEVIIRTKDLAFGVDVRDVDPVADTEADAVEVDARVEVGEFTTIIPDPKLGKDWNDSLGSIPIPIPSDSAGTVTVTVRGGAIGICRLISSNDMLATGMTNGVFKFSFCDSPLDR
jgi:hypothetical protein